MSADALSWAMAETRTSGQARLALWALADWADGLGLAYGRSSTLGERICPTGGPEVRRMAAKRAVAVLERLGLIVVVRLRKPPKAARKGATLFACDERGAWDTRLVILGMGRGQQELEELAREVRAGALLPYDGKPRKGGGKGAARWEHHVPRVGTPCSQGGNTMFPPSYNLLETPLQTKLQTPARARVEAVKAAIRAGRIASARFSGHLWRAEATAEGLRLTRDGGKPRQVVRDLDLNGVDLLDAAGEPASY